MKKLEETSQAAAPKPRTPMQKLRRGLLIALLVLVCLVCVLVLVGVALFHRYYLLMDYQPADHSIPSLTEEEISRVLEDLYGEESLLPEESELPTESREALDTSMEQALVSTPQEESEEMSEEPDEETEESLPPETESSEEVAPPPSEAAELSHVLIIGMDVEGVNKRARADTMILVTINKTSGKIVLTSLLRDLYVAVPGYPNNRLNAAFALGNVALLYKTIYANFGITIDRYVAIDFTAFTKIIDQLNGIQLELTEKDIANVFPGEDKAPGVYTLNGAQALLYARWRKGASDFDRTERQRILLETVIKRMFTMSLPELFSVMDATLPLVRTDLTESDCYAMLFSVGALAKYPITTQRIPFPGTWEYATINRKSVLTLDLEENRRLFFESVQ